MQQSPTCIRCGTLAPNAAALAVIDSNGKIEGYRDGYCLPHLRAERWSQIRPSRDYVTYGCPECEGHEAVGPISWALEGIDTSNYPTFYYNADMSENEAGTSVMLDLDDITNTLVVSLINHGNRNPTLAIFQPVAPDHTVSPSDVWNGTYHEQYVELRNNIAIDSFRCEGCDHYIDWDYS